MIKTAVDSVCLIAELKYKYKDSNGHNLEYFSSNIHVRNIF